MAEALLIAEYGRRRHQGVPLATATEKAVRQSAAPARAPRQEKKTTSAKAGRKKATVKKRKLSRKDQLIQDILRRLVPETLLEAIENGPKTAGE